MCIKYQVLKECLGGFDTNECYYFVRNDFVYSTNKKEMVRFEAENELCTNNEKLTDGFYSMITEGTGKSKIHRFVPVKHRDKTLNADVIFDSLINEKKENNVLQIDFANKNISLEIFNLQLHIMGENKFARIVPQHAFELLQKTKLKFNVTFNDCNVLFEVDTTCKREKFSYMTVLSRV